MIYWFTRIALLFLETLIIRNKHIDVDASRKPHYKRKGNNYRS